MIYIYIYDYICDSMHDCSCLEAELLDNQAPLLGLQEAAKHQDVHFRSEHFSEMEAPRDSESI